jgi:hypothetical protein
VFLRAQLSCKGLTIWLRAPSHRSAGRAQIGNRTIY